MTTNHHTPVVAGTIVTAETLNKPLGELDEAITNLNSILDPRNNLRLGGNWDNGHLVLNGAHIWVNEGKLYFNPNAPGNATDGTEIAS